MGDTLAGGNDVVEQQGQLARRVRVAPLLFDDELGKGKSAHVSLSML
jgi:uncharacterized protein YfiM (DUF2279 family)